MQPVDTDPRTSLTPRAWLWLLAGVALIAAANFRWGVGVLAWIAPVPLLQYLRLTRGWRSRLIFAGALLLAWTLALVKIVTAPVPLVAMFGFSVPTAVLFLVAYLAWDWLRRRGDDWRAVLAFPALMIAVEWLQHRFTPLASWAAAAYTQVDDLALLQVASLFGLVGVSFIVYAVAAAIDRALVAGPAGRRRWLAAAAALAIVPHVYGAIRLGAAGRPEREVRAAAIITDNRFGPAGIPTDEEMRANDDVLFERSLAAARAGAELVVWNEAGTVVLAEREQAFLARAAGVAREAGVELVVAYIKPIELDPILYENRYAWFRPDGTLDHIYDKHEPVPGEPAARGTQPLRTVSTSFGQATGAICYDYDFPYLALAHARLGADVVALPSSDWQGIDPIHTQMAAVRAIEGGFSILRSTRMGLSGGIDPYGRIRGWLSSHDSAERVLLVTLPAVRVPTLYARIGDVLVYASLAYLLAVAVLLGRPRGRTRA